MNPLRIWTNFLFTVAKKFEAYDELREKVAQFI